MKKGDLVLAFLYGVAAATAAHALWYRWALRADVDMSALEHLDRTTPWDLSVLD